jgi:hypothetical protein
VLASPGTGGAVTFQKDSNSGADLLVDVYGSYTRFP